MSSKKSATGYQLSDECQTIPRRYYVASSKKWVGVGGAIETKKGTKIPEATKEEYLEIGKTSSHVTLTGVATSRKAI